MRHKRQRHQLIIEDIEVAPGVLPDGTHMGKFTISTANLGDLEWMLTPRQAGMVAGVLDEYARTGRKYV